MKRIAIVVSIVLAALSTPSFSRASDMTVETLVRRSRDCAIGKVRVIGEYALFGFSARMEHRK